MKSASNPKRLQWGKPIIITQCNNRGRPVFVVSWYDEFGRRCRLSRATAQAAQEEAAAIADRLRRGQPIEVTLSQSDHQVLERSKEILKPHGIALDHAIATLSTALKHVDIHSLVEAARWFQLNRPASGLAKTGKEALEEMLAAKADRSHHTVADLRRKLTPFVETLNCPLATIGTEHIERYIHSLKVKPRTKANILRAIGTLMNFARRKRYIPQNHPGIKEVEPFRVDAPEIGIFTPQEMQTLLQNAPEDLLPVLVLGGFCGLRTEEIKKLDWSEVNVERGLIEIRAGKSKTRVRRLPKIGATLQAWLLTMARTSGPVSVYKNPVNELLKLAARSGLKWKRNGLRHSYISYRVAETEDVAAVALHAGNSPKMIHRNYLKYVDQAEAQKWFGIVPQALSECGKEVIAPQEVD